MQTYLHVVAAVSFALLIPLVLYLIYYRVYVLRELQVLDQAKKRAGVKGESPLPIPPCMHIPAAERLA